MIKIEKVEDLQKYSEEKMIKTIAENHRLNSIIKEATEYIEEMQVYDYEFNEYVVQVKELLEILDKGDNNE